MKRYDAVLFDLLTALIDSWSLWNRIAGGEAAGRAWRGEYLKLTYGCGAYRPYETLVEEAAVASGLPAARARELEKHWLTLEPWEDAQPLLRRRARDTAVLTAQRATRQPTSSDSSPCMVRCTCADGITDHRQVAQRCGRSRSGSCAHTSARWG